MSTAIANNNNATDLAAITADPYNWPFPKRQELMSLQTINQRDVGFPKYESTETRNRQFDLTDIRGASPEMRGYLYSNKETFVNRNDDIEKSSPRQLIKNLNKPEFQLVNKDIEGTQPQINKFQTTRQAFNPLQPQYQLPKAVVRLTTPPKFIRDSINIDDIQGSKPNPKFFKTRNVDIYTEIEGSKPTKLFIPRDHIDILDVKDINEFLQFKTTRHTNPLHPTYITQNEEGKKIEYGRIDGSESRRLHPIASTKVNFNLTTGDIKGAWHGTHAEKFLMNETRKDFRTTNITKDLPETQVGSLKKGIFTLRHVNPLTPHYQLLGQNEGLKNYDCFTNPVKDQSILMASRVNKADQNRPQTEQHQREQQSLVGSAVSQNTSNLPKREENFPRCQTSNELLRKRSSLKSQGSVSSTNENKQQNGVAKPPTPPGALVQKPPTPATMQFPKLQTIDASQLEGRVGSRGSQRDYNVSSQYTKDFSLKNNQ